MFMSQTCFPSAVRTEHQQGATRVFGARGSFVKPVTRMLIKLIKLLSPAFCFNVKSNIRRTLHIFILLMVT